MTTSPAQNQRAIDEDGDIETRSWVIKDEAAKLSSLVDHMNEAYAVEAEVVFCQYSRWHQITIDQGGKTIYAATVSIDNDAAEAKCRLIRFEIETMIAECELPILQMEDAA